MREFAGVTSLVDLEALIRRLGVTGAMLFVAACGAPRPLPIALLPCEPVLIGNQVASPSPPPARAVIDSARLRRDVPRPRSIPMPPSPNTRRSLAGEPLRITARILVDTTGLVARDSIMVCGVQDRAYAQRLAAAIAQMRFDPAERDGRLIVAPYVFNFTFH